MSDEHQYGKQALNNNAPSGKNETESRIRQPRLWRHQLSATRQNNQTTKYKKTINYDRHDDTRAAASLYVAHQRQGNKAGAEGAAVAVESWVNRAHHARG